MTKIDTIYIYDGSFNGFLCCIFKAFDCNEEPFDIAVTSTMLLPPFNVETDTAKSARVEKWLKAFGRYFMDIVTLNFLSGEQNMELDLLRLFRLANVRGESILSDLNNPLVYKIIKLAKAVKTESHRMLEFLRFSDYDGNLIATINPKYFVLPLISDHFEKRLPNENYFIYDEVHGAALAHTKGKTEIYPIENFIASKPSEEEEAFRNLWQLFYDTIEIKQRRNYKLRMQHLPKRFWHNITELKDKLD